MIGHTQLIRIARHVEALHGPLHCCGDLILEVRRALYGSETVSLSAKEQSEVLRYFETRNAASGSLRALVAQRREGRR